MAVKDHGLEALKKSAEEVVPGDKSDMFLKVGSVSGNPLKVLSGWLFEAPGRSIVRTEIDSVTEDYSYRQDATELIRIRIVYETADKSEINSAVRTV